VWLDRGELDKIIERATSLTSRRSRHEDDPFDDWERDDEKRYERKGRRRSFLSELFDFD
jgi:Zn-finger nucleic acid-binding protein